MACCAGEVVGISLEEALRRMDLLTRQRLWETHQNRRSEEALEESSSQLEISLRACRALLCAGEVL